MAGFGRSAFIYYKIGSIHSLSETCIFHRGLILDNSSFYIIIIRTDLYIYKLIFYKEVLPDNGPRTTKFFKP